MYLFIFGTTLSIFCSLLYRNFIIDHQNEFDIALYNHAVDISQGVNVGPFGKLAVNPDVLTLGGKIFPFAEGNVFIQILTRQGREVGRSRNLGQNHLPLFKNDLPLIRQGQATFHTLSSQEFQIQDPHKKSTHFRLLTALSPGQASGDFILQVAVPTTILSQAAQDIKKFFWIGIPLTLFLATFGGLYLSGTALSPVSDMIDKARSLSPDRLSDRIPVPPADDEIQKLALTLNALLDRLELAFQSQERFIADASHELKTPLAILRGEFEVFRSRPRTSEETQALIQSGLQELGHLSRVVEDLLVLARVDAGCSNLSKSSVHFEELVMEVISKLEILARKKDIKIRFNLTTENQDETFEVQGDYDLLIILIKNLLENAIKYSPKNDFIEVHLKSALEFIQVEIKDHGPGIPGSILPHIFQRFYRIPHSDTSKLLGHQGAGLGLAIAKKIAQVHGGEVDVSSDPGIETVFTARIKKL